MDRDKIKLNDDLMIETYPFSDYITCVEVYFKGESFSAFCSDNSIVDEWKDSPDTLIELCNEQILKRPKKVHPTSQNRQILEDGLEMEYYPFSDDVYCMNVFQQNTLVTSFCVDKASFEEWQDEPDSILEIVKKMLKPSTKT